MSKHTAGPWSVYPGKYRAAFVVPSAHLGRKLGGADDLLEDLNDYAQEICVVDHHHRHRSIAEQKANAFFVAAAPELLAALWSCVDLLERDFAGVAIAQPELDQAHKAFAKAYGSTP